MSNFKSWEYLTDEHLKKDDPTLKLDCIKGYSDESSVILFGDESSVLGCVYVTGHGMGIKEAETNVHLIAQAPKMYEEIELTLTECGKSMPSDRREALENVLAKARGESTN